MGSNDFIAYISERVLPLETEGAITSRLEQVIIGCNKLIDENGSCYDKQGFWPAEAISAFQKKYLTELLLGLVGKLRDKDIYSRDSFRIIKNAMQVSDSFNPGEVYAKNCARVKELAVEYLFEQV